MTTLREWRALEAQRVVEQRAREEGHEARTERYIEEAKLRGTRNLTASQYAAVAELVAKDHPTTVFSSGVCIGWPEDAPAMFNGSREPCDAWSGPCSCGAWHVAGT